MYDTRRQDNEAASASRAAAWLKEVGLDQHVETVERLILATRHQQPPEDADAGLVVDLDLAILAAPPAAYAGYERDIRREYAWVPEPLFRAGRATLLEHLLGAPRLYWHAPLRQGWEAPARANLGQALEELRK
ncbi:hypothetical protein [Pseudomonas sp. RIT-PI-AD]|uniref:HD domain-containing protein n=1 Tax=Pseudomonas sp. RIT-PI-AD TaxID=3035294 RepID=UPI0021DB63E0|nr:hypothetical protein [Pseudomonas sp. RIT-PI-AD]